MRWLHGFLGHPVWNFIMMVVALLTFIGVKVDKIMDFVLKRIDIRTSIEYTLLIIAIIFGWRAIFLFNKREKQPIPAPAEVVSPELKDIHRSLVRFAANTDTIQIGIPGKTGRSPHYPPHVEMGNLEWKSLIKGLCKLLEKNILYYRFGEEYCLIDLATGDVINFPKDITNDLTLQDSGIRPGMILELREMKH